MPLSMYTKSTSHPTHCHNPISLWVLGGKTTNLFSFLKLKKQQHIYNAALAEDHMCFLFEQIITYTFKKQRKRMQMKEREKENTLQALALSFSLSIHSFFQIFFCVFFFLVFKFIHASKWIYNTVACTTLIENEEVNKARMLEKGDKINIYIYILWRAIGERPKRLKKKYCHKYCTRIVCRLDVDNIEMHTHTHILIILSLFSHSFLLPI